MADEVESTAEVQTPTDAPQVEEAAPVEAEVSAPETEAVPESGVEQGELDTPTEEPVEPPTVELSRRDKALEEYADIFADERNTAAQLREQELRRESGAREQTADKLKVIRERLRKDPETDVDGDLNFLDDNNRANASAEQLAEFTKSFSEAFDPTPEERTRLTEAATTGNVSVVAATTLDAAARSIGLRAALEQDVATLVRDHPDSTLAQTFRAAQEQKAMSAATADATEEKHDTAAGNKAPPLTQGRPVVYDPEETDPLLVKLEEQGVGTLTVEERVKAHKLLGVPHP